MKTLILPILILLALTSTAQKKTAYYDFHWEETDASHARFASIIEHTDSGWHRVDYFVQGSVLQMEGWYEEFDCQTRNGKFVYGYADKKVQSIGRYVHNKRQGLCVSYHPNGMMADSAVYEAGQPVGVTMSWHPNGVPSDSASYAADGSSVEVSWFDNGNPSAAGYWSAGHKRNGRWKFFHNNGQLSALELYDNGQLLQKQYYDEKGQALSDTTNKDRKASFGRDSTAWLKYLGKTLEFPGDYKITRSDQAAVVVTFTVDVDGTIKDAYIRVPFYEPFNREALRTISTSPKWRPAIEHNRFVPADFTQPVIFSQPND